MDFPTLVFDRTFGTTGFPDIACWTRNLGPLDFPTLPVGPAVWDHWISRHCTLDPKLGTTGFQARQPQARQPQVRQPWATAAGHRQPPATATGHNHSHSRCRSQTGTGHSHRPQPQPQDKDSHRPQPQQPQDSQRQRHRVYNLIISALDLPRATCLDLPSYPDPCLTCPHPLRDCPAGAASWLAHCLVCGAGGGGAGGSGRGGGSGNGGRGRVSSRPSKTLEESPPWWRMMVIS